MNKHMRINRHSFFRFVLVILLTATATLTAVAKPAFAETDTWRLTGVMTTTVQVPNVYLTSSQVYQFQTNVEVLIDYPRQIGQYREQNPFSMVIQSVPMVNNYGEASIWSSLPAEGILFQYWTYNARQDGNRNVTFAGQLVNNHVAEALALNLITVPTEIAPNLWMPYTHAMANGTQMQGTLFTNGEMRVTVQGNTTDGFRPFRLDIVASLGTSNTNFSSFTGNESPEMERKVYLPAISK